MTLLPAARQRVMFVILCFVWGTRWFAMRVGIATVPPGVFDRSRWTFAVLILLFIRKLHAEPIRATPRIIGRLLLVAVLMVALNQTIQLCGLKYITAGLAAAISQALTSIALLDFSVAIGQEGLRPRQLVVMALLGVVDILVPFDASAISGTLDVQAVPGTSGVAIRYLCYSAGSVMARPLMRSLAPMRNGGAD